jgi:hypothetical protein
MTPLVELLLDVHAAGLRVRADGENLCVRPLDHLTIVLRQRLGAHKPDLLVALRDPRGAAQAVWDSVVRDVGERRDQLCHGQAGTPRIDDEALQEEAREALLAADHWRTIDVAVRWRAAWLGAIATAPEVGGKPDLSQLLVSAGGAEVMAKGLRHLLPQDGVQEMYRESGGLAECRRAEGTEDPAAAWSGTFGAIAQRWERELVEWISSAALPADPFVLDAARTVGDPATFFTTLRRDVEQGPGGPRARTGALQADLRLLKEWFGRETREVCAQPGERGLGVSEIAGQNAAPACEVEAVRGQHSESEADMKMSRFCGGYLRADDVHEDMVVTIRSVEERVVGGNGEGDLKPICRFEELGRALVLNQTTIRQLIEILGSDESEDWVGRRVTLYNDPSVCFEGRRTGGLRIRAAPSSKEEAAS